MPGPRRIPPGTGDARVYDITASTTPHNNNNNNNNNNSLSLSLSLSLILHTNNNNNIQHDEQLAQVPVVDEAAPQTRRQTRRSDRPTPTRFIAITTTTTHFEYDLQV
jgi:hypothetical protein